MTDGKIIHGFSDRLAIDQEVQALAHAANVLEMEQRAQSLATKGKAVLPALLRRLDTDDPTLRGGLALLAQRLDRDLIVPALYNVAADSRRPPAARLTAVMLLERYLHENIDPALSPYLPQAADVARQSAEQALHIAQTQPLVLIEYAEQLRQEPPDVIDSVIDIIAGLADPARADLLLAIAALGDLRLLARILPLLGAIRHPFALAALHTLVHLADPHSRPAILRQIRKLRLAGVPPAPPPLLRSLWTPTSAQGQSLLWFIHRQPQDTQAGLLICILHDQLGIVQADAQPAINLDTLPFPAAPGHLHHLRLSDSSQILHLIELHPAQGLELLAAAIGQMQAAEQPAPGELILFGRWLWQSDDPARDPAAAWPDLPPPAAEGAFSKLLQHPAFASWAWDLPDIALLLRQHDPATALIAASPAHRQVAARLATAPVAGLLAARLRTQARWFSLITDAAAGSHAGLCLAAAAAVEQGQADHPFVQALAWRSLLHAAATTTARRSRISHPPSPPHLS